MFRSKRTFDKYQHSIRKETATPDDLLSDDIDGDEDSANEVLNENDENNELMMDFDPSLMHITKGFNYDAETLVIGK